MNPVLTSELSTSKNKNKPSLEHISEDICTRGGDEDNAGRLDSTRAPAWPRSGLGAAVAQDVGKPQPHMSSGRSGYWSPYQPVTERHRVRRAVPIK